MNLQQLRVFCEVYRQRGFSPAARRLRLTQSAVSQQVRALERGLGVWLFDRQSRGHPTAAGDYLYKEGRAVLAAVEDLRRGIRQVGGVGAGEVRFGMIDVAAIELMPGALERFRREHPQVKVEAVVKTSGELIEMVENHELDFALAVVNRVPDSLTSAEVHADSIVAVMPKAAARGRRSCSVRELRGEPLILYPMSSHTRLVIEEAFRAGGVVPAVAMELHYPAAICALVRQGMGIGLISALSAEENRLRGQVALPVEELTGAMRLGLISHRRRRLSPQARSLMAAIAGKPASRKV